MAITAADLIEPLGPLTTTLFPGEDAKRLDARATAYLEAAATDSRVVAIIAADATQADAAKRAYALWRGFMAVYTRMNAEAASVNITEKGSHTYSVQQIANIKAMADDYLADLEDLVPEPTTDSVPLGTTSVPNTFVW